LKDPGLRLRLSSIYVHGLIGFADVPLRFWFSDLYFKSSISKTTDSAVTNLVIGLKIGLVDTETSVTYFL
jgi:hypothetical protein